MPCHYLPDLSGRPKPIAGENVVTTTNPAKVIILHANSVMMDAIRVARSAKGSTDRRACRDGLFPTDRDGLLQIRMGYVSQLRRAPRAVAFGDGLVCARSPRRTRVCSITGDGPSVTRHLRRSSSR